MNKSSKAFLFTIFSLLLLSSTIVSSYSVGTGNSIEKSSTISEENLSPPDTLPLPLPNLNNPQMSSNQIKTAQPIELPNMKNVNQTNHLLINNSSKLIANQFIPADWERGLIEIPSDFPWWKVYSKNGLPSCEQTGNRELTCTLIEGDNVSLIVDCHCES